MLVRGWEFWRLDTADGGELAWLAITRPGARSIGHLPDEVARFGDVDVVMDPPPRVAGVVLGDEPVGDEHAQGRNQGPDLGSVDRLSKEDLDRIVRPERCLTLDQIDRHPVVKVLGKRADEALKRRA